MPEPTPANTTAVAASSDVESTARLRSSRPAAIIEGSVLSDLDMSCFDGRYVTGTVSDEYLAWVEGSQTS